MCRWTWTSWAGLRQSWGSRACPPFCSTRAARSYTRCAEPTRLSCARRSPNWSRRGMGADAVPGAVRRDQVECGPGVVLWRSSQLFVSRYTKGSLTAIKPSATPPPLSPSVAVPPSAAVWSMPLCRVLWFFSIDYLRKKEEAEYIKTCERRACLIINYLCQKHYGAARLESHPSHSRLVTLCADKGVCKRLISKKCRSYIDTP
jgi:hypothetical protein